MFVRDRDQEGITPTLDGTVCIPGTNLEDSSHDSPILLAD